MSEVSSISTQYRRHPVQQMAPVVLGLYFLLGIFERLN